MLSRLVQNLPVLLLASAFFLPQAADARKTRKPLPGCEGNSKEHNSCDAPILETPGFALYWSLMTRGPGGFHGAHACAYVNQQIDSPVAVSLSLVFKTLDPKSSVVLDDEYKKRFESQILPAIAMRGCKGDYESVFIGHYMEKVYMAGGLGPLLIDPRLNSRYRFPGNLPEPGLRGMGEIPLSSTLIKFSKKKPVYEPIQSLLGVQPATLEALAALRNQRTADAVARQEARAAAEDARFRQSFKDLKEKAIPALGKMMEPALTANDARDRAAMEATGVFFHSSPVDDAGVTLCNKGDFALRVASLHEYSPRIANFDPSVPTQIRARGWGHLPAGACKRLVSHGTVFLRILEASGREAVYDVPKADINLSVCATDAADFDIRAATLEDVTRCPAGQPSIAFRYLIQHQKVHYTLTLR